MNKTLIVRYNYESSFTVTGTEKKIQAFIKWIANYHHGKYDGTNTINCNSSVDIWVCRQKARHEGLLPCISKDEIKSNMLCN